MNPKTNKASFADKQRGVSLPGMIMVMVVLALFGLVAAKLAPAYIDYFAIKKVLTAMQASGELKTMDSNALRQSYNKRASIDNIKSIDQGDLQITKAPDGTAIISVDYSVRTPLVGNVSLIVDFSASTAKTE